MPFRKNDKNPIFTCEFARSCIFGLSEDEPVLPSVRMPWDEVFRGLLSFDVRVTLLKCNSLGDRNLEPLLVSEFFGGTSSSECRALCNGAPSDNAKLLRFDRRGELLLDALPSERGDTDLGEMFDERDEATEMFTLSPPVLNLSRFTASSL